MNAKKIVSYTLLALIACILVAVVVLSFVFKKLSPVIADMAVDSTAVASPEEITVSKYVDSKEYIYRMQKEKVATDETIKEDYELVLNKFNNLGYFTYMQQLFLGLGDFKQEIVYGKTSSISALHKQTDGYLIEFIYENGQTLKNPDGSTYKDTYGKEVAFTKLDIFVDDSNEVSTYKIYIKTYSSDDTSVYYVYNMCANVADLYEVASDFDEAEKMQGKLA